MEVFGEDLLEDVVFEPVGYYWSSRSSVRPFKVGIDAGCSLLTYLAFSNCAARSAKRCRSAFFRSSGSCVAISL